MNDRNEDPAAQRSAAQWQRLRAGLYDCTALDDERQYLACLAEGVGEATPFLLPPDPSRTPPANPMRDPIARFVNDCHATLARLEAEDAIAGAAERAAWEAWWAERVHGYEQPVTRWG